MLFTDLRSLLGKNKEIYRAFVQDMCDTLSIGTCKDLWTLYEEKASIFKVHHLWHL
jgi:hypothetical protein